MRELERLNTKVNDATYVFEEAAKSLSLLSDEVAKLTSPSSAEGRTARCVAVKTALLSRDEDRARALLIRYLGEDGIDEGFSVELKVLFI